ncbi:MAG: 3-deoxy-D-manno-octulosonic acid transferase [Motiliproteus sp.]
MSQSSIGQPTFSPPPKRYQWLLRLLAPALLIAGRKQDPQRQSERHGNYTGALPQQPIWLHAASFGEAKAAGALIEAMRAQGYQGAWLITTTTRTGGEAIQPFLQPGDRHLYAPVDLQGVVKRAVAQICPRLLIVMEVEIWPNLWAECQQQGVPVVLANARLSESSLRKYQKFLPQLWRTTLQRAELILAQSEAIAARFRGLGVNANRLSITGNLKYSQPTPDDIEAQGQTLRSQLGSARPVWLAASTHDSEEAIAIECHRQLLQQQPDLLLILVPRHPQRFDTVAELCQQSGLDWQRRSQQNDRHVSPDSQIYLADTLGELLGFYAASDLCWVAGSFVDVGGHNILEPAACRCPMVVGPDMRNFTDIVAEFAEHSALLQVNTPQQLESEIGKLLLDTDRQRQQAQQAQRLSQQQRGTAERQASAILALVPSLPASNKVAQ